MYEYILMGMSVSFFSASIHSYSSLNALWDHSKPRIAASKSWLHLHLLAEVEQVISLFLSLLNKDGNSVIQHKMYWA